MSQLSQGERILDTLARVLEYFDKHTTDQEEAALSVELEEAMNELEDIIKDWYRIHAALAQIAYKANSTLRGDE